MTGEADHGPRKPRTQFHPIRARSWRERLRSNRPGPAPRRDADRPRLIEVCDFLVTDTRVRRVSVNRANVGRWLYFIE